MIRDDVLEFAHILERSSAQYLMSHLKCHSPRDAHVLVLRTGAHAVQSSSHSISVRRDKDLGHLALISTQQKSDMYEESHHCILLVREGILFSPASAFQYFPKSLTMLCPYHSTEEALRPVLMETPSAFACRPKSLAVV
jgi:hypothetical protein